MDLLTIAKNAGDELRVHYVPLAIAKDYFLEGNSKLHGLNDLIASFQEHGFRDPIIFDPSLNKGKGGVIAGNGRLEALVLMSSRKLDAPRGIKDDWSIPIAFGVNSETAAQAISFSIDHNHSVTWGSPLGLEESVSLFNVNALRDQIKVLKLEDYTPISFRGKMEALEIYLKEDEGEGEASGGSGGSSGSGSDESIEKYPVEVGDIWNLNGHMLYCGDSLDSEKMTKFVNLCERKVGMVWSDPPYGIAIQKGGGNIGGGKACQAKEYPAIAGDENPRTAGDAFDLYTTLYDKAVQIWWGANHYGAPPSSCWIVWDKKTKKMENGGDFADGELAWTNQKTAIRVFRHTWVGMIQDSEKGFARVHPTQKPMALFEWAHKKYGKEEGDFIVDPFLGSGMSIMAAEKMQCDHIVYGCEMSTDYCSVILNRFEALFNIKPEREFSIDEI